MNRVVINSGSFLLLVNSLVLAEPKEVSTLPLKPAATQSIFFNAALSILLATILLALVFYGLSWWRTRFNSAQTVTNESAPIIKSTRRVTQKSTLLTVVWQGKVYLLAESQGSLSVLDSVPIEVKTP